MAKQGTHDSQVLLALLRIANRGGSLDEIAGELVIALQELSGCEAVGLRLNDSEDYPYFETRGFSGEFVLAERSLCARDRHGIVRDDDGVPVLSCMCGNVIQCRTDPAQPFFTQGGSFWSNCTTELLANTTEAERQARTRNRCNGEGYESVALIPLSVSGHERIGLIQFNDRRRDRFTLARIEFFEEIAEAVANVVARKWAERELRGALKKHQLLSRELDHRLRNTLSSILAMLESSRAGTRENTLTDLRGKVGALLVTHKLLSECSWERIDLLQLCRSVVSSTAGEGSCCQLLFEGDAIEIDQDMSHYLALVLSELTSNSLRHCLGQPCQIAVQVEDRGEQVALTIRDQGPGYPQSETGDAPSSSGRGLEIVRGLVEHSLRGQVSMSNDGGAVTAITFPPCAPA